MKKHKVIDDKTLAQKFNRPVEEVKEKLEEISKKNSRKDWIISTLNNRYVFYNKGVIDRVKELYKMGLNEKRIFEKLEKESQIRTRAEIKAIEDILISQKKIKKHSNRI
jgi:hypothetical protein